MRRAPNPAIRLTYYRLYKPLPRVSPNLSLPGDFYPLPPPLTSEEEELEREVGKAIHGGADCREDGTARDQVTATEQEPDQLRTMQLLFSVSLLRAVPHCTSSPPPHCRVQGAPGERHCPHSAVDPRPSHHGEVGLTEMPCPCLPAPPRDPQTNVCWPPSHVGHFAGVTAIDATHAPLLVAGSFPFGVMRCARRASVRRSG